MDYQIKENLLYTENFWARVDYKEAIIGMTDFASKQAKDIAFIELPKIDTQVKAGKGVGVLESAKWSGEIVSPVSGRIIAINSELEKSPEKINADPYGQGWIFKIHVDNPIEFDNLMSPKKYEEFLKKQI